MFRASFFCKVLARAQFDEDFSSNFTLDKTSLFGFYYPACSSDKVQDSQFGAGAYGLWFNNILVQDSLVARNVTNMEIGGT